RQFAGHDERSDGDVGQTAVKRAHPDERKRAGIDARVVEQHLRRATECTSKQAPYDERRAEVTGAAPAPDGEARGDDLDGSQERQELDAAPPEGKPAGAADGELSGAITAAEDAEPLPGLSQSRADEEDDRRGEDPEGQPAQTGLAPLRDTQVARD